MKAPSVANNLPVIVPIIGAIVCIVGFFLDWTNGTVLIFDVSGNGIDFINNANDWDNGMDRWKCYIPLFCIILAVVAAFFAVVPASGVKMDCVVREIALISAGVLMIVFIAIFVNTTFNWADLASFKFSEHIGPGIYAAVTGALILAFSGVLEFVGFYEKFAS